MAGYDIGIIGGGPGGYVAAIRAAQLGRKVILFEKDRVGGLCLNWGCIPSKALLRNADIVNLVREADRWGISVTNPSYDLARAIDRSREVSEKIVGGVETLIKGNGIELVQGSAGLAGKGKVKAAGKTFDVANVVIATGASTRDLPGVKADGKVVITSREALELRKLPKRVVIVGGGPIGAEFAHFWASYGSQVTIVEMLETLLPLEDPDLGRALKRSFDGRGITSLLGTRVEGVTVKGRTATVSVANAEGKQTVTADAVLVAIGFVPHTEGLDLESAGVKTDRGFITIGDGMETNVPGVFAVGDVTGKLMLAHVAMQQGVIAAERAAARKTPVLDYVQMPRATFCQPQVGSIGYTEAGAKEAGYVTKTGRFPLTALGRAIAYGQPEGFVKVVADEPTGQVLGIHMIGHDVVDLLGEATMVALLEATTVGVGFAVHAHPTMAEAVKEAALAVEGQAIHFLQKRPSAAARPGAGR
ncbi:MAG: dihydrolipoyl dehydrogenase [Dehalococcoidia bacterium]